MLRAVADHNQDIDAYQGGGGIEVMPPNVFDYTSVLHWCSQSCSLSEASGTG